MRFCFSLKSVYGCGLLRRLRFLRGDNPFRESHLALIGFLIAFRQRDCRCANAVLQQLSAKPRIKILLASPQRGILADVTIPLAGEPGDIRSGRIALSRSGGKFRPRGIALRSQRRNLSPSRIALAGCGSQRCASRVPLARQSSDRCPRLVQLRHNVLFIFSRHIFLESFVVVFGLTQKRERQWKKKFHGCILGSWVATLLVTVKPYVDAFLSGIVIIAGWFIVFTILERLCSKRKPTKPWRETFLDLRYAVIGLFYEPFLSFLLAAVFGILSVRFTEPKDPPRPDALHFVAWLFAVLFVRDLFIYLRHRIFHLKSVWAFHSVHHSSEYLDWISAVRFHPGEMMIETAISILFFLACALMGVHSLVLAVASFLIAFYNLLIHSHLPWTFGPLRYLFVSPVFHHWHHSDSDSARDKNFAAMFSCIDLALGSFYMPKNVRPETFGLSKQEKRRYPRSFLGQLIYPILAHIIRARR
ncbi:MAG TPA: sterol desaturase family protein [Verrucomicrobiae bacterium]|nr:sterol desaturase family protein [Verrucomicrobiae bacterium]